VSASDLISGPATPELVCEELPEDGTTLYVGNELRLHGGVAEADAATVVVEAAGESLPVARAPGDASHGWEVHVDTSGWEPGRRPIRIVARNATGSETVRTGTLDVLPYAAAATTLDGMAADVAAGRLGFACDEPPLEGTFAAGHLITVRGWAFAKHGLEGVFVALDGRLRQPARTGLQRRDLAKLIDPGAGDAGWQLGLDLSDIPDGEHRITVVAVARDGSAVGVAGSIDVRGAAGRPTSSWRHPDYAHQTLERFVPEEFRGHLIAAEHQARYRWAAPLAAGVDVLDAASGEGYGAAILAQAGARRVVGVDRDPEAVLNARERAGDLAEFMLGDLRSLPFQDAAFDVVTCFEAIEHVIDPDAVFDELRRVLRDDGRLLISTPNRETYTPGNPHHVHEYTPSELEAALHRRFANVRLHRQNAHLASLLAGDEATGAADGAEPLAAEVRKLAATPSELFTIAIASNAELPPLGDVLMLGGVFEARELIETTWRLEDRAIAAEAEAAANCGERDAAVLARERAEQLADQSETRRRSAQAELDAVLRSRSWRIAMLMRRALHAVRRRPRP
jgi:2-polyprenyl-3-methyl-5-hydroxy-6-metoxy-1,4-benzoquinol methylase